MLQLSNKNIITTKPVSINQAQHQNHYFPILLPLPSKTPKIKIISSLYYISGTIVDRFQLNKRNLKHPNFSKSPKRKSIIDSLLIVNF